MKKTALMAMAVAACLALSIQFAAAQTIVTGGATTGSEASPYTIPGSSVQIAPSNNVSIAMISGATGYGMIAAHTSGDRIFGSTGSSTSTETRIFWASTGTTAPKSHAKWTAGASSTIDFGAAGWSAY